MQVEHNLLAPGDREGVEAVLQIQDEETILVDFEVRDLEGGQVEQGAVDHCDCLRVDEAWPVDVQDFDVVVVGVCGPKHCSDEILETCVGVSVPVYPPRFYLLRFDQGLGHEFGCLLAAQVHIEKHILDLFGLGVGVEAVD